MKKYKYILGVAFMLSISSCDKALEVTPQGETLTEDALQTGADLQLLLNSAYDVLSGTDGRFLGGRSQIFAELLADNLNGVALTNSDFRSFYNRSTSYFNGTTRDYFTEPYITIYRANTLLQNLDKVSNITEEEKKRIRGEALFLRAISHFDVVRLFAQPYGFTADNSHPGVPLRLEPSKDVAPRATVGEVYAQIIKDLEEAASLLPPSNSVYATSWAAKGYLAKVHFQMNDFQKAYAYADDVIENGGFTLDPDLMNRFSPEGTPEAIFQITSTAAAGQGRVNRGRAFSDNYRSNTVNNGTLRISRDLYNQATADPNDKRGELWYKVVNEGQPNEEIFITKYNDKDFLNVPLLHLTELKLIRAEAAAELNTNLDKAVQDLNDIRNRAYGEGNKTVPANATPSQIISIARLERRLEMATEGNRVHELKRIGVLENNNFTIRGAVWNCPGLVVQFPNAELAGNPDFQPNPEGGCN